MADDRRSSGARTDVAAPTRGGGAPTGASQIAPAPPSDGGGLGARTIGSYEIEGVLGEGGIGRVYAAHDQVLGRRVAIKTLRPELSRDRSFVERFYAEAKNLGHLNHPNITTVYAWHAEADDAFMVMELVLGYTLDAMLAREHRFSLRDSLAVLVQAAAGIGHAHRMGIVHRDLKPANLMVTHDGAVKIMDFGIARVRGSEHLTRVGDFCGTFLYASPEQIRGEEVDERSDLYSLAIVFYRLLAGHPPFTTNNEYALMTAQLQAAPPPLLGQVPDLDAATEAVVMRALAKRPEDRFASVEEFARAAGAMALRGESADILQQLCARIFGKNDAERTPIVTAAAVPPHRPSQAVGLKSISSAACRPREEATAAAVFISYSSRDQAAAQRLCDDLERRGLPCWISYRDVRPGESFLEAIVRAIRSTQVMAVVFSVNANQYGAEILKEITLAERYGCAVIPIRIENVVPEGAFVYAFATRQWIDLFNNWELGVEQMAAHIAQIDLHSVAEPEPPPKPAVRQRIAASPAAITRAAPPPAIGHGRPATRRPWLIGGGVLALPLLVAAYYLAAGGGPTVSSPSRSGSPAVASSPSSAAPPKRPPAAQEVQSLPTPAPFEPTKAVSPPAPAGRDSANPTADRTAAATPAGGEAADPATGGTATGTRVASAPPGMDTANPAPTGGTHVASAPPGMDTANPAPTGGTQVASTPPGVTANPPTEPPAATPPLVTPAPPPPLEQPSAPAPEATAKPPTPEGEPDLQGRVTGVKGLNEIELNNSRWIRLYGIVDRARGSQASQHVEALKRYLKPSQNHLVCYHKEADTYRCYSDGQDVARLALHDRLVQLAPNAPREYRELQSQRQ